MFPSVPWRHPPDTIYQHLLCASGSVGVSDRLVSELMGPGETRCVTVWLRQTPISKLSLRASLHLLKRRWLRNNLPRLVHACMCVVECWYFPGCAVTLTPCPNMKENKNLWKPAYCGRMAKGQTRHPGWTTQLHQSHCHCIYLLTSITSQQGRVTHPSCQPQAGSFLSLYSNSFFLQKGSKSKRH